jgi:HD-GYP domain-containing protein (c-di-GMP phosphodiesterase class II)
LVSTVCVLASALDARDKYTKGHADRVSAYAVVLAEKLGWSGQSRRDLELAAHLHDIGKVGVPDEVLLKPGRFTEDEFAIMKRHSAIGASIVSNSPEVRHVAQTICQHHERIDGSGYPCGLRGEEITPAARILGVADAFDAMTSNRPYRDAMDEQTALGIIQRARGIEFEPNVVDALVDIIEDGDVDAVLEYGYCLTH